MTEIVLDVVETKDEPDYLAAERAASVQQLADSRPQLDEFLDPDLDEFLATDDPPYDFVIPDILERLDRLIITASEGDGKSTLLRQIGVQVAAGIHPFTERDMPPIRVHHIDCENSERQARRALRPLRALIGDLYVPGNFRVNVVGHALDLARPEVYASIELRVKAHRPDLIAIGPLYKMTDGDPTKEEPARELADALDRLRSICGSALLIEAHTPYGESSKATRPLRPYGASLWSRWPEFGLHLGKDGTLTHWRGPRDERAWPKKLVRSDPWPWAVDDATADVEPWDGPTHCMDAVAQYLAEYPDDEFAKSALPPKLRAIGRNYRDTTVYQALESLAAKGQISHRRGPRNADLYRHDRGDAPLDF